METNYLDDRVVSNAPPCRHNFVKFTKKSLNEFISWTTSRYNDYLGFGNKKDNVQTVFESFNLGYLVNAYYNRKGEKVISRIYESIKIFTIECATGVGERPTNSHGSSRYWSVKKSGDTYIIDCNNRTIYAIYSKRVIKFI